ncbi:hypothetical protein J1605_005559 [Eschrichtius robustus]|uniref:RFX-type winged-helix domain-containing protein n=1 Tax=Eschrichtius robustus TaxID=9764 RepID=A0AB34H539_ESCRO|nr:hypothetical protein J1605_005559 [Eschrichtius robustus]
MAEGVSASASGGAGGWGLHGGIIQWLVDNFCICEGYSVPHCLMYEMYVETCGQNAQNQVNPATFGKAVGVLSQGSSRAPLPSPQGHWLASRLSSIRSPLPKPGTDCKGLTISPSGISVNPLPLGPRYHYDGICIKKSSFFYARYCYLLGEKRYHRVSLTCSSPAETPRQGNVLSAEEGWHPVAEFCLRKPSLTCKIRAQSTPAVFTQPDALGADALDLDLHGPPLASETRPSSFQFPEYPKECPRKMAVTIQRLYGDVVAFEKSANYNSILQEEGAGASRSPNKTDPVGSPLSEFRRCPFWEQELAKKYSYKTMAFLADEYCNYCQDILQNVRNQELKRVEDSLTSFWKSLQQDTVMLMSLPDVCQLLKCYDRQLYKGIEDVLLHDFLEDVSIQHLESVQSFSKKFKLWLLTALEGLPDLLQLSKRREVTVFVKRLRRKTYLSNMAKTMRTVLENSRRASLLKSDLRAIIRQGALDISEKALRSNPSGTDDLEENTEMKCNPLSSAAWLQFEQFNFFAGDVNRPQCIPELSVFKSPNICLPAAHSHPVRAEDAVRGRPSTLAPVGPKHGASHPSRHHTLKAEAAGKDLDEEVGFHWEPSRSKEELIRLAASFQLRWNFLLTAVSKAMTLWHRDSFGSWHLFHLLLLEYVIHILQSCIEEDEEGGDVGNLQEMLPDDQPLVPPDQELSRPPDPSPAQERRSPSADPHRVTLRHKSHSQCATEGSSVVVRVPGFLVDIVTGDKVQMPEPQLPSCFQGDENCQVVRKPTEGIRCPNKGTGF